jgi:CheY-like chemotaxis protein
MRGYCDLVLGEAQADDPLGVAVQQIRLAAERARATTSQLLAFSRRGGYEPQVVDLNQIIEQLHHPVAKMIGEAIRIRLEPAPRLPQVEVDPSGLQQALFNLIINARDAQPDGGLIILRTGRHGDGEVALEVIDAGCGMAADLIDRVWEPFFTTKDPGEGTGLGLAMVRSFIEQSGGRVGLTSTPGGGTTARIYLPVAVASAGVPAAAGVATRDAGQRRGRILLVEDDDGVRRVGASILEHAGHQVVEARGPGEAIQRAASASAPFDLLLTDVIMPDMGGEDLAALLVARGQVARVMFMSGYGTSSRDQHAGPLISKPFSAAGLLAAVATQLDRAATDPSSTFTRVCSAEAHR